MRQLGFVARVISGVFFIAFTIPALGQSATRMQLTVSPSPSTSGQRVTMTADVDALGGPAPTGNVTFSDGATTLGADVLRYAGAGQATLSAGDLFNCALTNASGLKCWGWNAFGQLGDGTFNFKPSPVDVNGLASGVTSVDAGADHTCALNSAGGAICWGYNGDGAVGDGTNVTRSAPVAVSGLAGGVSSISAGADHSCAATRYGAAKCWGWNRDGQIGDGTSGNSRLTPRTVAGLASGSGAVDVSAGGTHSCALLSTGAVKCWGSNAWGELGNDKAAGTVPISPTPVTVTGIASGATALSMGKGFGCAIINRGLKCWGRNWYGALGDGTTFDRHVPTGVVGLGSGVAAVSAGADHVCALTTGAGVKCWGRNDFGQVGDGTTTNRWSPVDVAGLTSGAVAVATGQYHSCALLRTGGVKCWGYNANGQIGDGTTVNRPTPTPTSSLATLVRARARFSTTTLTVGVHTIKANYPGDATHTGVKRAMSHTVN